MLKILNPKPPALILGPVAIPKHVSMALRKDEPGDISKAEDGEQSGLLDPPMPEGDPDAVSDEESPETGPNLRDFAYNLLVLLMDTK